MCEISKVIDHIDLLLTIALAMCCSSSSSFFVAKNTKRTESAAMRHRDTLPSSETTKCEREC